MKHRRIFTWFAILTLLLSTLTGCGSYSSYYSTTVIQEETGDTENTGEVEPVVYEAMMYDNQGNNFLNFSGNNFSISPNKVKQYGWNTDGNWTRYYETSSVVTIEIDGQYIQTCGSTVLFKDQRLDMLAIPSTLSTKEVAGDDSYTVSVNPRIADSYLGLTAWWYDAREKGQHGEKLILVQSQDGYNIGAFAGNDITWEVAEKLPKTTRIMIDGMPLYIHRCNFTIIDSGLMETPVE